MAKHFSIPEPCSENWNEMTPTQKGAFCAKCSKEVIDCSSVKTTKIKSLLAGVQKPCVRINSNQLDELNFIEWFNALRLSKQIKYLFLFAFLFVFQFNGSAQSTQEEQVQPQFVAIDSVDEVSKAALNEEIIADEIPVLHFPAEIVDPNLLVYNPLEITTTGGTVAIIEPLFYGDMISIEDPFVIYTETTSCTIKNPLLSNCSNDSTEIKQSNYLIVGENYYTFFIDGNNLLFNTNSSNGASIQIKIQKKGEEAIIYFNPIRIPSGQNQYTFPLTNFENGAYVIIVEESELSGGVELVYW